MTACVYTCPLIKLLGRAIQHVPWKQRLPWKECFFANSKRNKGLILLSQLSIKKKNLTIEIIDIRVVPEKHHYEQSDPAHAQRSILAMALQQSALLCNSRAAHYPFPHPTLQSAPFKSACDVCPLTHVRAGATWEQVHKVITQCSRRKWQSSTCQVLPLLKYEAFSVKMHMVLQTNEKRESN